MNEDVTRGINEIRTLFLESLHRLPEIQSFGALLSSSQGVRNGFQQVVDVSRRPRIADPCVGEVTCAIIGSSGHGKTTVLDEMFPSLSERGWLVTDVTDTTGQSLRIEQGSGDALNDVSVRSWTAEQIKGLMQHQEVAEQNERDNVRVTYLENGVAVDGSDATFAPDDLKQFRFPRKMELIPFAGRYQVPSDKAADKRFIRGLTVKEPQAVLRTEPLIESGGRHYDALQLRAVVQDVTLRDPFERLVRWSGRSAEQLEHLTVIDTPGLATPGNTKDEVLRHFLEKKAAHIALELWKNDELDIVIHLVLCGRSSDFAGLWKEIERECGPAEMESLAERLILAVNGVNIYFTNRDIKAKYEDEETLKRDGDQFVATLEDNILQKMSPRGSVAPAKVCFLDSQSIVETLTGTDYGEAYERYRPIMEGWVAPGGAGHETLKRLGMLDAFRDNIDALCDADDRGQGLLTRRLLELIDEKGGALLLRKHVVRSGLLDAIVQTRDLLSGSYDEEGRLNRDAVRAALKSCLAFLDEGDLESIERFCVLRLDEAIEAAVPRGPNARYSDRWTEDAFYAMCERLQSCLLEEAEKGGVPGEVASEFFRHYDARVRVWVDRFGYQDAKLLSPDKGFASSGDLVVHCLKLHCREILYQLLTEEDGDEQAAAIHQSADDREQIQQVMADLSKARDLARRACANHGVNA